MPAEEGALFFRRVLEVLGDGGIPFMVGGAYALERLTGIHRDTADFDLFVLPEDAPRALEFLAGNGFRTELTFPHWLGKVYRRRRYVDLIFNSGNGVVRVDPGWFERATRHELFGREVLLCPIEEMIWSKSFVMERERCDIADVMHLLRAGGARLDWPRLVARFGPHARVLLAHLVMFGFVYPNERHVVPREVIAELVARLDEAPPVAGDVCMGTLLSRSQYLPDVETWGLADGRRELGLMSDEEIARWTDAGREP